MKRKPLERNASLQYYGHKTEMISEYVEKMIDDYVNAFPDVDANDLFILLNNHAGYACVLANLNSGLQLGQTVAIINNVDAGMVAKIMNIVGNEIYVQFEDGTENVYPSECIEEIEP